MIIYDTYRKRKVELVPSAERHVDTPGVREKNAGRGDGGQSRFGIYLCGPTVYDYGHLGHGRSAIVFDILRRYLLYKGHAVTYVRNWTDIDDKTIDRAKREGVSVRELTERFIKIYEEDFRALNILEPDFAPKPTDNIPEIIAVIERLFKNGHAYALPDGVYYDISTFEGYGALSGQALDELRAGARVDVAGGKRNPGDFVLWKFEKPGEPSWESPWGRGRPGWHIECSAMAVKYLGDEFDIHCGGQDLKFPHHEDEIAQSKGAGFGFARHWMHNGFLNIDNEKMSKSLGNFFTLREVFEKFNPLAVRFFLMSAHYRAPLNFSEDTLRQAAQALSRFNDFIQRVSEIAGTTASAGLPAVSAATSAADANAETAAASDAEASSGTAAAREGQVGKEAARSVAVLVERAKSGFEEGLDDDLNVSKALAELSDFLRDVNILIDRGELAPQGARLVLDFMKEVDSVLGVFTFGRELLPGEIERRIEERLRARKAKDFKKADAIRRELLELGILLEDTPEGTRWKKRP
jgi:cysteinyl-tRNA synthetase